MIAVVIVVGVVRLEAVERDGESAAPL